MVMSITVGAVVLVTIALVAVAGYMIDRNAETNDRKNY
jgi:hypothetical protein